MERHVHGEKVKSGASEISALFRPLFKVNCEKKKLARFSLTSERRKMGPPPSIAWGV